ncbi:excalibur calcium-binding domain-containing protein [Thiofilum flexile]|uniref:excalibur calcium-binding domain-containing protein n=1 Tax=Thiofilum flexile TaxID=125627 RepID=UPI00039B3E10|nr:excalibur calcium-binding domain-containing protein [Thiofilum flexile]
MKNQLLTGLMITLLLSTSVVYAKGVSCKSFSKQSDAQDYVNAKKQGWKSLDRDGDGEACECLPGGSKYGESVCRSWRKKNGK